jgi:4-diphosphocytidyl-2-C-methyl-D-erythritol kinase
MGIVVYASSWSVGMPSRPLGERWSTWPSPAKLNLFLHIVGRRRDGYHLLQTVFQLLEWGDEIRIRPRADGRIERISGAEGVLPENDLAVRAARLLQASGPTGAGADLAITKRIPMGGGFGGGSSNAATVLVALDALWGTRLGVDRLAELGLQLGADVPVFVRGRSAWAENVGDMLTPLALGRRWYLVVDSGVSVPTRELFQAPDLTRDASSATIADFDSGKLRGNAFEPVLCRCAPAVAEVMRVLNGHGRAQLTGTGGGVFVAFDDPGRADAALDRLPSGCSAWVVEGVDRSPLLNRLEAFTRGNER